MEEVWDGRSMSKKGDIQKLSTPVIDGRSTQASGCEIE